MGNYFPIGRATTGSTTPGQGGSGNTSNQELALSSTKSRDQSHWSWMQSNILIRTRMQFIVIPRRAIIMYFSLSYYFKLSNPLGLRRFNALLGVKLFNIYQKNKNSFYPHAIILKVNIWNRYYLIRYRRKSMRSIISFPFGFSTNRLGLLNLKICASV